MRSQDGLWIAGLLVTALLQTLAVLSAEHVATKITPSHAEEQKKKHSETLKESETRFYQTNHGSVINTYKPTIYYQMDQVFTHFPTSSPGPTQNVPGANIHQQIQCGDTFSQVCQNSRYRSYDGSCNNLRNPTWGLANTRYGRLVRPRYSDGIRAPTKSITGTDLPLARTVSYTIFPNRDVDDKIWSLLSMQYGQIMTHDMGLIDGTTQSKSHSTRCCTFDGQLVPDMETMPRCYPILIPYDDPVYNASSMQCMNFVRSTTDLDRGCASHLYKPAEQLNTVTHYLDLSLVYGSSNDVAASLRAGFGGRLNVEMKNNRQFPPPAPNKTAICDTVYEHEACYATGDSRANQNPHLTILQIVLLREHNRIADYLAKLNPHWTDETTFQETRRIVIAENQNIAYYEWLPIILGYPEVYGKKITYDTLGYVNDYDETVNANTLNEHANAANRYFHSLIAGNLNMISEDRSYSFYDLRLSDYFNRPGIIEEGNNLDDLTRGLSFQPEKAADRNFDKEITQFFFRRGRTLGSDLRATDVQRDRDHGLASYNDYREYCGLPRAHNFVDFTDHIRIEDVQKLSMLYASPDDVELTVGGSLERHVPNTLSGLTFLCIMSKQFQLTRTGDRYWFETGDPEIAFTIEQLKEIRKSSISRLLCDNADHIQHMQPMGFVQVSVSNPLMNCDNLPRVDLSLWKDYAPESRDYEYQHIMEPQYKKK